MPSRVGKRAPIKAIPCSLRKMEVYVHFGCHLEKMSATPCLLYGGNCTPSSQLLKTETWISLTLSLLLTPAPVHPLLCLSAATTLGTTALSLAWMTVVTSQVPTLSLCLFCSTAKRAVPMPARSIIPSLISWRKQNSDSGYNQTDFQYQLLLLSCGQIISLFLLIIIL